MLHFTEKTNLASVMKDRRLNTSTHHIVALISDLVCDNLQSFSSIEIKKLLPAQLTVSCRSDSSSDADFSCGLRSDA